MSTICVSFIKELYEGVHQAGDTYKMALYVAAAALDRDVTAYSATGEVSGTGYIAGGQVLTGYAIGSSGARAWIDFNDPIWANASITARYGLIYNSTRANRAVVVVDFEANKSSTNGMFAVGLPDPNAETAVIEFSA